MNTVFVCTGLPIQQKDNSKEKAKTTSLTRAMKSCNQIGRGRLKTQINQREKLGEGEKREGGKEPRVTGVS